ncbi:MAG: alpha/beta fold hydrolase [Halobacteriota archaeon]
MNLPSETSSTPSTDVPGESTFVELSEVTLHTVQAGPRDGPLVVLLHGFPEFWYAWYDHIRPLANAGYRVVAPDQRGYNLSDKPSGLSSYRIGKLADDVVALVEALGYERAHLVGHDWGAFVAWWVALHYPTYVRSLCAINGPHPDVFRQTLKHSWGQRMRSGYALFFQLPLLPETVARAGNWRAFVRMMRRTSRPGTFTATDFQRYRDAWERPGALTAMFNWYRAVLRRPERPQHDCVRPPTLVIWGARDNVLKKSMARESVARCASGRAALIEDGTHWVHHEESVRVVDLLRNHFRC